MNAGFARTHAVDEPIEGIKISSDKLKELWRAALPLLSTIPFKSERQDGMRYYFDNDAFAYGDGSMLYAILRLFQPNRIIEVGSGYSSACCIDTIDKYFEGKCEVTFIEPYPRRLYSILGEAKGGYRLIQRQVQTVGVELFRSLQANDILFIDLMHVLKTGSDVCFELFEILPVLQSGVIVHFHDVFWPFEYPEQWTLVENRSWNELYALRAFLMYNENYDVIFFNDYFAKLEASWISATYPLFLRNPGGGLWLRKV